MQALLDNIVGDGGDGLESGGADDLSTAGPGRQPLCLGRLLCKPHITPQTTSDDDDDDDDDDEDLHVSNPKIRCVYQQNCE